MIKEGKEWKGKGEARKEKEKRDKGNNSLAKNQIPVFFKNVFPI